MKSGDAGPKDRTTRPAGLPSRRHYPDQVRWVLLSRSSPERRPSPRGRCYPRPRIAASPAVERCGKNVTASEIFTRARAIALSRVACSDTFPDDSESWDTNAAGLPSASKWRVNGDRSGGAIDNERIFLAHSRVGSCAHGFSRGSVARRGRLFSDRLRPASEGSGRRGRRRFARRHVTVAQSGRPRRSRAPDAAKSFDLGPVANAIIGALGGAGGGSILTSLVPALAGAAGNGGFDIAVFAGQLVGGGVSGAIVTAIVGLIRNALVQKQRA